MNTKTTTAALAAAWLVAAAPPAGADETIRCSGRLVERGDPLARVAALCGEPEQREVERIPVRGRGARGASIPIGTTTVEHWTYERGRRFPARITFEDGSVERIELLTGA